MWKHFQGQSPVVEKLIFHPEFRKRENGEIENDLAIVRTSPQLFARAEPAIPICLFSDQGVKREGDLLQFFWVNDVRRMSQPIAIKSKVMNKDGEECKWNVKPETATRYDPMRRMCVQIPTSENFCPSNVEASTSGYLARYDSGADQLILVGIFSYGESVCQQQERPTEVAVFTKVEGYLDWIIKNIKAGDCSPAAG